MKKILLEEGAGRVLVVDGRGSLKCALMGDAMTARAVAKGELLPRCHAATLHFTLQCAALHCTALHYPVLSMTLHCTACAENACTCRRLWRSRVHPAFCYPPTRLPVVRLQAGAALWCTAQSVTARRWASECEQLPSTRRTRPRCTCHTDMLPPSAPPTPLLQV